MTGRKSRRRQSQVFRASVRSFFFVARQWRACTSCPLPRLIHSTYREFNAHERGGHRAGSVRFEVKLTFEVYGTKGFAFWVKLLPHEYNE